MAAISAFEKIKLNFLYFKWGKWFLIIIGLLITLIILIIPMIFIFITAFSQGFIEIKRNLNNDEMLHAIRLTVMIAIITVPVNMLFSVPMAWLITKFNFYGRQLLLMCMDIPFSLSPVIIGLLYLISYGMHSPIGSWLHDYNINLMFSWPGMTLVTIFVTCPFIIRELIPIMLSQGTIEEESAMMLGASAWKIFYYITFPNIRWALLYGIIMTNARAIGEFGAVSIVSGSIRGETCTLPLQIELLYQDYNIVGAFTAASLLAIVAIITLFLKSYLQQRTLINIKY